jgi:hypothetical protein
MSSFSIDVPKLTSRLQAMLATGLEDAADGSCSSFMLHCKKSLHHPESLL